MTLTSRVDAAMSDSGEMEVDSKVAALLAVCDLCGMDHTAQVCPQFVETEERPATTMSLAEMTLPKGFYIEMDHTGVPQVVCLHDIPAKTKLGPFEAKRTLMPLKDNVGFVLQVFRADGGYVTLDTSSENECNWLCLIPTALSEAEQNLMVVQLNTDIFYLTTKVIKAGQYLKVWYSPHYAMKLGKPTQPDGGRTSTLLSFSSVVRHSTAPCAAGGESVNGGGVLPAAEETKPVAIANVQLCNGELTGFESLAADNEASDGFESQAATTADRALLSPGNDNAGPERYLTNCGNPFLSDCNEKCSAVQSALLNGATCNSAALFTDGWSDVCTKTVDAGHESLADQSSSQSAATRIPTALVDDDRNVLCVEIVRADCDSLVRPSLPTRMTKNKQRRTKKNKRGVFAVQADGETTQAVGRVWRCKVCNLSFSGPRGLGKHKQSCNSSLPLKSEPVSDLETSPTVAPLSLSTSTVSSLPILPVESAEACRGTYRRLPNINDRAETSVIHEVNEPELFNLSLPVQPSATVRLPLTADDYALLGMKPCSVVIELSARKRAVEKLDSISTATEGDDGSINTKERAKRRRLPPKRLLDSNLITDDASCSSSSCDYSTRFVLEEISRKNRENGCSEQAQVPSGILTGVIVGDDRSIPLVQSQGSRTSVLSVAPATTTATGSGLSMPTSVTIGAVVYRDPPPATQCRDCGVTFAKKKSLALHRCFGDGHSNGDLQNVALAALEAFRRDDDGAYYCPECASEQSIAAVVACRKADSAASGDAIIELSAALAQLAATSAAITFHSAAELQQHLIRHSTHFQCDVCLGRIPITNAAEHCLTCTGPSDVMEVEANSDVIFEGDRAALKCGHCEVTFKYPMYLNRHMLIHRGAYKCGGCSVDFPGRFLLLQHLAECNRQLLASILGTDALAYVCKECTLPFATPVALSTHLAVCHFERYMCRQCDMQFSSKSLFEAHDCIGILCSDPPPSFGSPEMMQRHFASQVMTFPCTVCNRSFSRRQDFVRHNLECEGKKMLKEKGTIKCPSCSETFKDLGEYMTHAYAHTNPHRCSLCDRRFLRKINAIQHEKSCVKYVSKRLTGAVVQASETAAASTHEGGPVGRHTGIMMQPAETGGVSAGQGRSIGEVQRSSETVVLQPAAVSAITASEAGLLASSTAAVPIGAASTVASSDKERSVPCTSGRLRNKGGVVDLVECIVCQRLYSSRSSLNKHLKTHGEKQFQCPACQKMFHEYHAMRQHYDTVHTDLLRATCPHCAKRFRTKYTMLNHVRQFHTEDVQMHSCSKCGRSFRQRGNLRKHLLMHESQHRYQCLPCELTFRYPEQYRRHMLIHSQGRSLQCGHCERKFVLQHELRKHERDYHCTTVFVCPLCREVCRWRHTMRRHIKRLHPNHGFPLDTTEFITSLMRDTRDMNAPAPSGNPNADGSVGAVSHQPLLQKENSQASSSCPLADAPATGASAAASNALPVQVQLGSTVPASSVVSAEGFVPSGNFLACPAPPRMRVSSGKARRKRTASAAGARIPSTRSLLGIDAVAAAAAEATAAAAGTSNVKPAARSTRRKARSSRGVSAPTGLTAAIIPDVSMAVATEEKPLLSDNSDVRVWQTVEYVDPAACFAPMETSRPEETSQASALDVSAPEALRGATINIYMEEGVSLTPESAGALQDALTKNLDSLANCPNPVVLTVGAQQFTITVTNDSQTLLVPDVTVPQPIAAVGQPFESATTATTAAPTAVDLPPSVEI